MGGTQTHTHTHTHTTKSTYTCKKYKIPQKLIFLFFEHFFFLHVRTHTTQHNTQITMHYTQKYTRYQKINNNRYINFEFERTFSCCFCLYTNVTETNQEPIFFCVQERYSQIKTEDFRFLQFSFTEETFG